ncbi:hypothetical protein [Streptomyces griseoluteus]|uniref:hypothetical protein n=1 Tax=Streptomyces griseoluteus TaxID=29306 RepID=UPI00367FD63D
MQVHTDDPASTKLLLWTSRWGSAQLSWKCGALVSTGSHFGLVEEPYPPSRPRWGSAARAQQAASDAAAKVSA